jgi:hypothetical protein
VQAFTQPPNPPFFLLRYFLLCSYVRFPIIHARSQNCAFSYPCKIQIVSFHIHVGG